MDIRRHGIDKPSVKLKNMEHAMRELASIIERHLPHGWGFALQTFDFNSQDSTWISNAKRPDMVKMLREFADRLDMDEAGGPVPPSSQ